MPSPVLSKEALKVRVFPSGFSCVMASILGQNTSLSCDSNQLICIVPLDSQRQIADRVRNHVRKWGKRANSSPSRGAAAAPALKGSS